MLVTRIRYTKSGHEETVAGSANDRFTPSTSNLRLVHGFGGLYEISHSEMLAWLTEAAISCALPPGHDRVHVST